MLGVYRHCSYGYRESRPPLRVTRAAVEPPGVAVPSLRQWGAAAPNVGIVPTSSRAFIDVWLIWESYASRSVSPSRAETPSVSQPRQRPGYSDHRRDAPGAQAPLGQHG